MEVGGGGGMLDFSCGFWSSNSVTPDDRIIPSCSLFGFLLVNFVQIKRFLPTATNNKNRTTSTICHHLLVSRLSFFKPPERQSGGGTAGKPDSTPSRFAF